MLVFSSISSRIFDSDFDFDVFIHLIFFYLQLITSLQRAFTNDTSFLNVSGMFGSHVESNEYRC